MVCTCICWFIIFIYHPKVSFSFSLVSYQMANPKKVAVYSIRIDCGGCERTLAKTLAKIHGVEMFVMDRNTHTLQVTGQIDEMEVLRKLMKKKKRKKIELISVKEEEEVEISPQAIDDAPDHRIDYEQNAHSSSMEERLTMFNDENPNSCSVM